MQAHMRTEEQEPEPEPEMETAGRDGRGRGRGRGPRGRAAQTTSRQAKASLTRAMHARMFPAAERWLASLINAAPAQCFCYTEPVGFDPLAACGVCNACIRLLSLPLRERERGLQIKQGLENRSGRRPPR